jgi:NAD(P)-dependent dehydrogenase (short-subunit alcohol dehydrogenase family)
MKKKFKTLIITGGTSGIGKVITNTFLKNDWNVVIGSRNKPINFKKQSSNLKHFQMDVKYENNHNDLFQYALSLYKKIDCFVNCAGFSKWSPIGKIDEDDWNHMIDTNLKGSFFGCKVASKFLKKNTSIINISSIAGKRGSANNSLYNISKFGITALTQSLAKELGPKGIRVNSVCPVYVKTKGLANALKDKHSPSGKIKTDVFLNNFAKNNTALLRLPKAEEVAQTCLYLASQNSSAITGQNINVDCGTFPQ